MDGERPDRERPDSVDEIAAAWRRERPGTPVDGIGVVTRIWRLAKLFEDDRRRTLAAAGCDAATLDLLSVLRRSGPPYRLTTRELTRRTLVTAGAISQRVTRAERTGLVTREPGGDSRRAVTITLTPAGHDLVEHTVDHVLGRESDLLRPLTPAQRQELSLLLSTLLTDLTDRLRR